MDLLPAEKPGFARGTPPCLTQVRPTHQEVRQCKASDEDRPCGRGTKVSALKGPVKSARLRSQGKKKIKPPKFKRESLTNKYVTIAIDRMLMRPTKFLCWNRTLSVTVCRGRAFVRYVGVGHAGEGLMKGISVFCQQAPERSPPHRGRRW